MQAGAHGGAGKASRDVRFEPLSPTTPNTTAGYLYHVYPARIQREEEGMRASTHAELDAIAVTCHKAPPPPLPSLSPHTRLKRIFFFFLHPVNVVSKYNSKLEPSTSFLKRRRNRRRCGAGWKREKEERCVCRGEGALRGWGEHCIP